MSYLDDYLSTFNSVDAYVDHCATLHPPSPDFRDDYSPEEIAEIMADVDQMCRVEMETWASDMPF